MTSPYSVDQRGEFLFAVLGPNPDAGKDGVSYNGKYLTICTTDDRENAGMIARALNETARATRHAAVIRSVLA